MSLGEWALIVGEHSADVAGTVRALAAHLRAMGLRVGGYVQDKLRDDEGRKRFELERLSTGERCVLAVDGVMARGEDQEEFCSMAFRFSSFAQARQWIESDAETADVLVVDGVSKMEAAGAA